MSDNVEENEIADENNLTEEANDNNESFSLLDDENPDASSKPFEPGVKPEGLPDELWDEENQTFKGEDLFTRWQQAEDRAKGLRAKLSRGEGKPPKSTEGYTLDMTDEEQELLANVIQDDDPVIHKLKEVCLENKVSNQVYQSIVKDVGAFLGQHAQEIASGEHLSEEQRAELRQAEYKKIGPNAPAVVRAVTGWGRELYNQGVISEDDMKTVMSIGSSGEGVRFLNIMRQMTGGDDIPVSSTLNDGLPSDAEIFDMMKSQKYMDGDAETHARVDDLLNKRIQAGRPERLNV